MANSYTTFPDSVQTFDLKTDVSSSVYSVWKQFNTHITNGEFALATSLLQTNAELQKCIIDSVYINKLSKTIEELQTMFLNNIQTYIHETVINKGSWNSTTKYTKYNFVTYPVNGIIQSFECLSDATPIATLPTNTTYWIPRIIQGEKGASGLGLAPRGIWNGTALYLVNDFVAHNNAFWQCLIQNSNNEPTESNINWLKLASLGDEITRQLEILHTEITSETSSAISNHDSLVTTESGAHGFRYYQNELQYKTGTTWNTIETGVGGSYVGTTAPSNTEILWVDTANGGILKYHNGTSWTTVKSVWG
jgi:hypothetical protein